MVWVSSQLLLPIFSTEKKIREGFSYREYYGDCSVRLKISSLFGALSRKVLLKPPRKRYLQNIREKRLLTRGLVEETFLTHWKGQAGESLTNVNMKREKKC